MGLFLGVGMAFIVEYMDRSIKTTEDVERVVQLPSLGVVPLCVRDRTNQPGGPQARKKTAHLDEKPPGSEPFPRKIWI